MKKLCMKLTLEMTYTPTEEEQAAYDEMTPEEKAEQRATAERELLADVTEAMGLKEAAAAEGIKYLLRAKSWVEDTDIIGEGYPV